MAYETTGYLNMSGSKKVNTSPSMYLDELPSTATRLVASRLACRISHIVIPGILVSFSTVSARLKVKHYLFRGMVAAALLATFPTYAETANADATGYASCKMPASGAPSTQSPSGAGTGEIGTFGLESQLERAQKDIARRDFDQAASELREVASSLGCQALHADAGMAARLRRDENALRKAADEVAAGQVVHRRHLDRKIARVSATLALHYYTEATKAWEKRKLSEAGAALAASARYAERGLASYGSRADDRLWATVKFGEKLGGEDAVAAESKFNAYRRELGAVIDRLERATVQLADE